jgi:hypothetical protein
MTTRFKRARFLAPIIGAAVALIMSATPASAAPVILGVGQATGFVQSTGVTSGQCAPSTPSSGYVFSSVQIPGVFTDGAGVTPALDVPVNNPPPAGKATSDPLNGTPLGCDGLVGQTVCDLLGTAPPPVGQDPSNPCGTGPTSSNTLADEGYVAGAMNTPSSRFGCSGPVACSWNGTFVRYGTVVLVSLHGCMDTNAGTCTGNANRVVLTANVYPTGVLSALGLGPNDNFLTGPFVVTGPGTSAAVDALDPAVNALYCAPAVANQTAGLYNATTGPICDGTSGL